MAKQEYRNVGDKPLEMASGRLLPIGEATDKVNLDRVTKDNPQNDKASIDAGVLIPVEKDEEKKEA